MYLSINNLITITNYQSFFFFLKRYIVDKEVLEPIIRDDEAEGDKYKDLNDIAGLGNKKNKRNNKKKQRGQNKKRELDQQFTKDDIKICDPIANGKECQFGSENCRFSHDIKAYIDSKPIDLDGICPSFQKVGICSNGVRCRWLFTHFDKENMKLIVDEEKVKKAAESDFEINRVPTKIQNNLQRKKFPLEKAEAYISYLDSMVIRNDRDSDKTNNGEKKQNENNEKNDKDEEKEKVEQSEKVEQNIIIDNDTKREETKNEMSSYIEPPFLPSEKKKIYLKGAKIVSPLTTVGNLPYRRLMKTLGADVTYSEMALALPLIQGNKSEWALPRAHSSEIGGFGVQIAAAKHWQATKAAEAIAKLTTNVSELNLNCGCPIDLIYRQGAGSGLLDNPARLLRIANGMSAVSDDIPVTIKIRMGTRDNHPTAKNLVTRIVQDGTARAITLHGRSRQQRYTKTCDWSYIKEVADLIEVEAEKTERDGGKPWFIGNGDVYTYEDYNNAINESHCDSVMVARGALIKPWIFEEIESQQYLDKSATERLEYIKAYAEYGLQHWGTDEYGINITRRYLCEFLSFSHRYIPVGILERLPPHLNDRPPKWQGRNEMETLLGSRDYKDWIKITEMYLGKTNDKFQYTPKHKSSSY